MTRDQIETLGQQLLGVAAIFAPGHVSAIGGLLRIGTELNGLLRQIREDDPEAWEAVRRDYSAALSGFEASVARKG